MDRAFNMDAEEQYSQDWEKSSKYFYDKGYYAQMCRPIDKYNTVFEIGCGTGYSTLALAECGHQVIAIEKNHSCIQKAKDLIQSKGFCDQVKFIEGDVVTDEIINYVFRYYQFDIVVCWNVGTYWDDESLHYYLPYMLDYGLNWEDIMDSTESSYTELILWDACRIASDKEVPLHIIDRSTEGFNETNDCYYRELGEEFGYTDITLESFNGDSLSKNGRMLSCNGVPYAEEKTNLVFLSILLNVKSKTNYS